jgi:GNAT superfamily N-acetyltransferase
VAQITLRLLTPDDEPFLWEMLYQAIYTPSGALPPRRDIVTQPEIARYVKGWGRAGDFGLAAVDEDSMEPLGAAWLRLWTEEEKGYGYVDNRTPELSAAILPAYRGQGVGTQLLRACFKSVSRS